MIPLRRRRVKAVLGLFLYLALELSSLALSLRRILVSKYSTLVPDVYSPSPISIESIGYFSVYLAFHSAIESAAIANSCDPSKISPATDIRRNVR